MCNLIKTLTKKEWALWFGSLLAVIISNIMTGNIDLLTLAATCIGATALIFAAKGNVWSQILMTIFCILSSLSMICMGLSVGKKEKLWLPTI